MRPQDSTGNEYRGILSLPDESCELTLYCMVVLHVVNHMSVSLFVTGVSIFWHVFGAI